MTAITRRHVAIAKKYLSCVEPEYQQEAQEILEYLAAEHLKLSGVIRMLSQKALAILDASIEDFKRKEGEQ